MQRRALRLRLDAYHERILLPADGVTFAVSARDAIAGRGGSGSGSGWTLPAGSFHTSWLLLQTVVPK